MEEIIPVTRIERLLAQAAGMSVSAPTPVTRIERLLQQIADKTGYTETIKTAASVTLISINNVMNFGPISGRLVSLVEGRTYTVSVASDDPDVPLFFPTTECVCVDISGGAGHALVIGNQALLDADESEDTGEWFMILEVFQEGEWLSIPLWGIPSISATDSITANVTSSAEIVHTINPKYLPEGGVGYTEPAKVLTCDGDTNGKNVYGYECRVSPKVFDLSTFATITMIVNGEGMTLTKEQWIVSGGYVTADGIGSEREGNIVSTHQEPWGDNYPVGTYVVCVGHFYVSRIEFPETVHTINPVYLKPAMPKIINLREYDFGGTTLEQTFFALLSQGGGATTFGYNKQFYDDIATERNIRVRIPLDLVGMTDLVLETDRINRAGPVGSYGLLTFDFILFYGSFRNKVTCIIGNDNGIGSMLVLLEPITLPT